MAQSFCVQGLGFLGPEPLKPVCSAAAFKTEWKEALQPAFGLSRTARAPENQMQPFGGPGPGR